MKNVNQLINERNKNINIMGYLVNNQTFKLDKNLIASTLSTPTLHKTLKQDELKLFYHNIEKKLSILPIFLMIAGTLGNLIALYVLTRKKLRHQSTMLYFASLTIMDTLSLYQWNFNFFYKYQLNSVYQNLEDQSLFLCRYISFMAYFSMQTSAWILTIISIDRYLIITNYYWKQKFSRNIRFSIIIIVTVILIIAIINFPTVFFNGRVNNYINIKTLNNSISSSSSKSSNKNNILLSRDIIVKKKVECYTTDYIIFWQKFSLLLECVFPLILMIIFNLLLIKRTYKSSINLQKKSKDVANARKNSSFASHNSAIESNIVNNSTILKLSNSCYDLTYLDQSSSVNNQSNSFKTASMSANTNGNSRFKCCNCNNANKIKKPFKIPCLTYSNSNSNKNNNNNASCDNSKKKKSNLNKSKRTKRLDSYIEEETTGNEYSTTPNNRPNNDISSAVSAPGCNESLANLEFLKYSYSVNKLSLLYKEPTSSSFAMATTSFSPDGINLNNSLSNALNDLEQKNSSCDNQTNNLNVNPHHQTTRHTTTRSSDRKINNIRNRRIVLMLSLLTLSFTISTLPSSVFYTFLRPIINDKPYKRLLTMSFNLWRHLSHAFNFIIYFTSSSVIKQQLKETIKELKKKEVSMSCCFKLAKYWCCCFLCFIPIGLKHLTTRRFQSSTSSGNKKTQKAKTQLNEPHLEASFINNHDFTNVNRLNGIYLDESSIFNLQVDRSLRRNSLISVHSNLFNNSKTETTAQAKQNLIPNNNSSSRVDTNENLNKQDVNMDLKENEHAALGDLNNLDSNSKLKVNSFKKKKFFL